MSSGKRRARAGAAILAGSLFALALGAAPASSTWLPQNSGTTNRLHDVHFPLDPVTGYAVGNSGTILKTTDGGTTWSTQVSGVTETLRGVCFPMDAMTGYTVGTNGIILKTTDGGGTWIALDSPTGFGLRGLHFPVDALTGWVVGGVGKIYKTSDAGVTWIPQESPTVERLEKVFFPLHETRGYIAAELGLMLRTSDGGESWTFSNTAQVEDLLDMHFPADPDTGWTVGGSGTILKTTNAGGNWSSQASGTSEDLHGVYFPNPETGYAVGASGVVLATTDGGGSWTPQTSGTTVSLLGVHFPSLLFGYAVGDDGTILKKTIGPDLGVSKTVDNTDPVENDTISYTVVLANNGSVGATGVEVTDLLPAGVTYVSADATLGAYVDTTGVWTVGPLMSAAFETLTITATVDAGTGGTAIANIASVTALDQLDENPANDTDSAVINVLPPISPRSTAIEITPDGLEGWVVNPDHGSVSVFATQGESANTLLAEIAVGRDPWCLDVHPTNGEVWVASRRDDHVYIIDAATRTVVDSVAAGFDTFGVAFDPAGTVALVTASGSDEIFVVDVASRTVTHTFDVYRRPKGIAWRSDGGRAWVSHLFTFEYTGKMTVVDPQSWTTSEINIQQVFGLNQGGYPAMMQNITLAPAPGDSILWIPTHLINSAKGQLSGLPLTPMNLFHAVVRPVNVETETDMNWDTYFLSEGGTPASGYSGGTTSVGGPIAVDFKRGRAYVANFHSNDVTVLDDDILDPTEILVFPAGKTPIGIVAHRTMDRVYVANWLSRDVTVFDTNSNLVIATIPVTTTEVLFPQVLNGKQLFFTSTGKMSLNNRNSCSGCHVFGRPDGRTWDLSQFGRYVRATPDWRGAGFTGPFGWSVTFDEIQDNEWSIRGLNGGEGLISGMPNPNFGPPNRGLSRDLDDLSLFIATSEKRPDTPFLNPDGSLTAEADSGQVLFHDPVVGCATCHPAPFYTDSSPLEDPYIRHDVGTRVPEDSTSVDGFDTPSLVGVWDSAPYLHHHQAKTMEQLLTTFNPDDLHGTTSHLSPDQIDYLAEFTLSIGWPDSLGTPVDSPLETPGESWTDSFDRIYPNPFSHRTSLRFTLENNGSRVEIVVFDVQGRRVRSLLDRQLTRGTHLVGWDSRDARGMKVAAGIYFARLVVNGREESVKKMTVLH